MKGIFLPFKVISDIIYLIRLKFYLLYIKMDCLKRKYFGILFNL